jgi:phosphoenolpyruvate carboxylase
MPSRPNLPAVASCPQYNVDTTSGSDPDNTSGSDPETTTRTRRPATAPPHTEEDLRVLRTAARRRSGSAPKIARSASFLCGQEVKGLHGDLDAKMQVIGAHFLSIYRQQVGPLQFTRAKALLNQLNDPAVPFGARLQQARQLVQDHALRHPQAIGDLLKLIDCQLMVYGVVEDQAHTVRSTHGAAVDDSVRSLCRLHGNDPQQVRAALAAMTVTSVLTAHPTNLHDPEAMLRLHQASEAFADPAALHQACIELWSNSDVRAQRPSVADEARHNLPHLARMQHQIRRLHKKIDGGIADHAGAAVIGPLAQVDSWIGGDRDGNVLVTAEVMKQVMALQAEQALARYQDKLSAERQGPTHLRAQLDHFAPGQAAAIEARIAATRLALPGTGAAPAITTVDEQIEAPVDALIDVVIGESVDASIDASVGADAAAVAYGNPQELLAELASLQAALPVGPVQEKLARFMREVAGAGFHAAAVDVRQNSAAHQSSVADLLQHAGIIDDYAGLPEADKQQLLWRLLKADGAPLHDSGKAYLPQTSSEMAVFEAIRDIHHTYGESAMPNYIIANTETVSDILEPMLLLQQVGLAGPGGLKMNLVPLIETVPDLKNGREIVGTLLRQPEYRDWLKARGNLQQIMVGYSDSNRLDGPLASNWEIYKALHYLQEVARENGVELLVFHGRGGTIARGAGTHPEQEVDMLPGGGARHGVRHTEQGEEIALKYGSAKAAERHLQAIAAATIDANIPYDRSEEPLDHAVMEKLSSRSAAVYRKLVFESPGFIDYYNQATPVGYVQNVNAGSRASSRASLLGREVTLDQLRAIPWVAGWYQSRALVPAWYGTGTALAEQLRPEGATASDPDTLQHLRDMYQDWPFLRHLVDRTETEMAKVDLDVMQAYAGLVQDPAVGEAIHADLRSEFLRTRELLLEIKQTGRLLEKEQAVSASLARRAPLLGSANALQVALLEAERSATDGPEKTALVTGIVKSMQAIQSGLGRFG